MAEHRRVAQIGYRADAAHLNREADQPVGQHADAVHHEVHHHGVVGVLRAAQTGLDDGESGLHEHDQEAGDQGPDEVDGDLVLADLIGDVADGEAFRLGGLVGDGIGDGNVGDGAGEAAVGIAVGASFRVGTGEAF